MRRMKVFSEIEAAQRMAECMVSSLQLEHWTWRDVMRHADNIESRHADYNLIYKINETEETHTRTMRNHKLHLRSTFSCSDTRSCTSRHSRTCCLYTNSPACCRYIYTYRRRRRSNGCCSHIHRPRRGTCIRNFRVPPSQLHRILRTTVLPRRCRPVSLPDVYAMQRWTRIKQWVNCLAYIIIWAYNAQYIKLLQAYAYMQCRGSYF